MRVLLKFFKGYRLPSVLGPLFKLIEALLELTVPLFVATIIDKAIPSQNQTLVLQQIGWLFLIAVLGLLFADTAQYFSAKAAVGFTRQMNQALFNKMMYLGQDQIDTQSPASLINRLSSDSLQVQSGINTFFRLFLRSPFIVIGSMLMAMSISARVTTIFLVMIISLFVVVGLLSRLSNPYFVKVRQNFDKLVQLARQQVQGIRVIRAFNRQADELDEFSQANQDLFNNNLRANNWATMSGPVTYVIVNTALIIILWQGGSWVHLGNIEQGQLVALVNYLLAILVELVKLAMVVATLTKTYNSAQRISQVFHLQEEGAELSLDQVGDGPALLEAKDLSFTYPLAKGPVLSNLNFSILPGEFIGLIGSTGSGKSSLIALFLQAYQISQGHLTYHTDYFHTQDKDSLRQSIAWVPQKARLFKGTVASNLRLANPNASEADMWRALDHAQASEFLREKEGLDTPVQAFGNNFSGGQRQRLTIARALVKPAQLYIFDDSTSALDYLTEAKFHQALRDHYQDKTILMVSQRTHSVQEADKILVLEAGQQMGWGRHQELLQTVEVYREIHESQRVRGDE